MLSIYVHFPFCERKCAYCDFVSFKCDEKTKEKYVEKLILEVKAKATKYKDVVSTIYFGGGTPTSVDADLIGQVLNEIKANFEIESDAEITIEGNPATFDESKLEKLKKYGFNRFSVGIQSFNDVELNAIERLHNGENAKTACELLKKYFPNYSLDLMLGIPFQTMETLENSIKQAVLLEPKHISCYMLKIENGTPLQKYVENGKFTIADDDLMADMYDFTVKKLAESGYNQYETSNFAIDGYFSRHNMAYWTMKNYIGLGISAHSLVGKRRFFNGDNLTEYLENGYREITEETLNENDELEEYIMLGLRLNSGIELQEFEKIFHQSFTEKYKAT
ncbi:MAG: radical SAM family heme chaperone HemW, partial [Clostridia bacterium]